MAAATPEERAVARTRRIWDRQAERWDATAGSEQRLIGDVRRRLMGHAVGRVLEVGIGTGRNLPLYSSAVTEVVGVDISSRMLARARANSAAVGFPVDLRTAEGRRLPFPDGAFDTVVCTLALCEIPDQQAALQEMHRLLRPGGPLLLLDHVEYSRGPLRWVERLRARWRRVLPRRRPVDLAREEGFEVASHEELLLGFVDAVLAHKPASDASER